MPKLINIVDFQEGLELSQPIKNKFGQVLLSAGVKIEKKHLKLIKIWGIETISVKGDSSESVNTQYDEETLNKAKSKLKERLMWAPKNANEKDLNELALILLLEKLSL